MVKREPKAQIYHLIYVPTLTYSLEHCLVTEIKSHIQATEMGFLQRVFGLISSTNVEELRYMEGAGSTTAAPFVKRRQAK